MKVLGIDPGYDRCGFAILDGGKLGRMGYFTASKNKEVSQRIQEIAVDFEEILKSEQPDVVSLESLFFAKNSTTCLRVAELRGVLIFLAQKYNVTIAEPSPTQVKKCFTGNGKASKSDMQRMAKLIFKLQSSPKVDDTVDAIAFAFFANR